jgi:hypothetical protein
LNVDIVCERCGVVTLPSPVRNQLCEKQSQATSSSIQYLTVSDTTVVVLLSSLALAILWYLQQRQPHTSAQ